MKNEEAKLNQNFIVPFVIAVQRVSSCFSSEWECCRPTKAMIYFSNCISFRCFCWCRCVCVGWLIVLAVLFSLLFSFTQTDLLQFNKSFSTALRKFSFLHLFIYIFFSQGSKCFAVFEKGKILRSPTHGVVARKEEECAMACVYAKNVRDLLLNDSLCEYINPRKEISKIGKND